MTSLSRERCCFLLSYTLLATLLVLAYRDRVCISVAGSVPDKLLHSTREGARV
jgi:hypothetical protein